MSENRYDLRQDNDGTWTVFDIFTGLPARVNEVEQIGLEMEQADDLVDLLNLLYAWAGSLRGAYPLFSFAPRRPVLSSCAIARAAANEAFASSSGCNGASLRSGSTTQSRCISSIAASVVKSLPAIRISLSLPRFASRRSPAGVIPPCGNAIGMMSLRRIGALGSGLSSSGCRI